MRAYRTDLMIGQNASTNRLADINLNTQATLYYVSNCNRNPSNSFNLFDVGFFLRIILISLFKCFELWMFLGRAFLNALLIKMRLVCVFFKAGGFF